MKRIFKIFIVLTLLLTNFELVFALSENEVINRINTSSSYLKTTSQSLIDWSNNNKESLNIFTDRNFLNKIKNYDIEDILNETIKQLKNKGYNKASNELNNLKQSLINNINYLKESLNITKIYLINNQDSSVIGSLDLFIAIRSLAKNNKENMSNLLKIYQNLYIDYINNKIDKSFTSLNDIYDDLYTMDIVSNLFIKSKDFVEIYNKYHLEDYENLFKEYFQTYYNRLKKDYNKIYDKLENKMQTTLDNKINNAIVLSTNDRNNALYNIINDIKNKHEIVDKKINDLKEKTILTIVGYINEYQSEIKKRFDEAINYTKSYIIDNVSLNSKDNKVLISNGLITYNGTNLNLTNFLKQLTANYNIKTTNTYNKNIGTKSKIQITSGNNILREYIIIVKGDVSPSGKIDITDIVSLCNKMFNKITLDNYQTVAADINNDNRIDITDIVLLCNKIFG